MRLQMAIMRHHLVKVTYETRTFVIDITCNIVVSVKKSHLNDVQFYSILIELDPI